MGGQVHGGRFHAFIRNARESKKEFNGGGSLSARGLAPFTSLKSKIAAKLRRVLPGTYAQASLILRGPVIYDAKSEIPEWPNSELPHEHGQQVAEFVPDL